MNIYQKLKKAGYMTDGLTSPLKIDPPKGKKSASAKGKDIDPGFSNPKFDGVKVSKDIDPGFGKGLPTPKGKDIDPGFSSSITQELENASKIRKKEEAKKAKAEKERQEWFKSNVTLY